MGYVLHKFGGSSLADSEKIARVAEIITGKDEAIVVSASGKTTRMLQASIDLACKGKAYQGSIAAVYEHHINLSDALEIKDGAWLESFEQDIKHIKQMLSTIALTGICGHQLCYFILGFGELWSAKLLSLYLTQRGVRAKFVDASKILLIDDTQMPVILDWGFSQMNIKEHMDYANYDVHVITGFIAKNLEAQRSILGMNCSDYSAAIFAKLLQAELLNIWTDVAGVYSANPQTVDSARKLQQLSYKEALELAYFGASVVHPLTMGPIMEVNIPIYIKSSFAPNEPGTRITQHLDQDNIDQHLIKGLTSISGVALMRVQGAGIIGVSGVASQVFSALEDYHISVLMISQSSSEYSLCFAVDGKLATKAVKCLERYFKAEIERGEIEHIYCEQNYSLITAVGDGMRAQPGALARVIQPLADAKVNIHAITQGSSERSITVTVKEEDEKTALNLIHAQARRIPLIDVAVAIVGVGNVAQAFIKQLQTQKAKLLEHNIRVRVVALMNSRKMVCVENGLSQLDLSDCTLLLKNSQSLSNLDELKHYMESLPTAHKIMIDGTANPQVAKEYVDFLARKVHVITPNKYANTIDYKYYQAIRKMADMQNVCFKYETNVCAGLPLISTLQMMLLSGDKINKIQGVFSGTLSFIFNQMNAGKTFVQSLMSAYENGYTEPDPREDLSGMDVARKVVCLAREIGLEVELSDLSVQNLTPEALRQCSKEEFLEKISSFDDEISCQLNDIKGKAKGLHFIGEINANGQIQVSAQAINKGSPFSGLSGADNTVLMYSNRYPSSPLSITGAGAGAEVTASGVFFDMLSLVNKT